MNIRTRVERLEKADPDTRPLCELTNEELDSEIEALAAKLAAAGVTPDDADTALDAEIARLKARIAALGSKVIAPA